MDRLQRFFWFCSGVNKEVLLKHTTEHNKYFSIGATVFFTAVFAALSGGYALWFVFSGSNLAVVFALVFGLLWGLAIFNLDRYIVSSISKHGSWFKQLLQALPRLILAILVAVVIARPLELKIFDKEIRSKLKENYLSDHKAKIDTINLSFAKKYTIELNKRTSLQKEADSLDKEVKQLRYVLNQEIFGDRTNQTSGKMGYGPYAKMKEGVIIEKEKRLAFLRAEGLTLDSLIASRKELDGLNRQVILDERSLDSMANVAGFADRNRGLAQISVLRNGKDDGSTPTAVLFISLLFVAFECLPVIVKLLTAKGPYDEEIFAIESVKMHELLKEGEKKIEVRNAMQERAVELELNKQLKLNEERTEAETITELAEIEDWKKQKLTPNKELYTDQT
ncbi:DUF4407 domain-containing protein [Solitalea longa]|uniref:DUF4407 domain-containing protein n=1 Tax=Solitalea longa TaxID=2079460 RepID=A0A2S5A3Q0_9SPHI|nr:DUF4407 domain-containing protein [Solitalea longa]POY36937.1 DUF4407 domain-containing protein [Solitalea longa]